MFGAEAAAMFLHRDFRQETPQPRDKFCVDAPVRIMWSHQIEMHAAIAEMAEVTNPDLWKFRL